MSISTLLMILGLLFTNAHNVPLDELGCHKDPPQGKYHCHTGALKGKEFAHKEDAERAVAAVHADGDEADFAVEGYEEVPDRQDTTPTAMAAIDVGAGGRSPASDNPIKSAVGDKLNLPPVEGPPTAVVNTNLLKIVSWKVKKRDKVDVDRIANILAEVDVAVLHGLDLDEVGRGPLHKMGDLLQARIGEKICRMWFRNSSGGKEKIGILWRNSSIAHVDTGGTVKATCGEMAVIVPINGKKGDRALATTLFYSKTQKKMFMLGTANFDSRPGSLTSVFKSLESTTWPTIVIGDLKTPNGPATNDLKKTYNFKTAMAGSPPAKKGRGMKSSTDNVWTKNATATRAVMVNLYDHFSEMATKDIDAKVSESFPVLAEVELVPDSGDTAPTMTITPEKKPKKAKEAKKIVPKAKVISEAKAPEVFDDPSEDLEAEAHRSEPETKRTPASDKGVNGKKKPKKKKR